MNTFQNPFDVLNTIEKRLSNIEDALAKLIGSESKPDDKSLTFSYGKYLPDIQSHKKQNPLEGLAAWFERLETAITSEKQHIIEDNNESDIIGSADCAKLLGLSLHTIYTKVSRGEIPYMKAPGSKKIYFSKSELTEIIKGGKRKTRFEIKEGAKLT